MEYYLNTDVPVMPVIMSNNRIAATPAVASLTFPINIDILPVDATSAAVTITLPLISRSWSNGVGRVVCIKKIDSSANGVTVQRNGTDLIQGANSLALTSQWSSIWLIATPVVISGQPNWLVLASN